MKKWICLVMTTILCAMAVTACGSSNGQGNDAQKSNAEAVGQESVEDTVQSAEAEEQEDVAAPEAEVQQETADAGSDAQEAAGAQDSQQETGAADSEGQEAVGSTDGQAGKVLVVYYSASGNTKAVGDIIAQYTGGDTFEIIPVNAYTSEDLDWTEDGSRVNQEHEDESLQDIELVSTTVDNFDSYDTVFIGYPIWWHEAAWVVNNFVKDNDFTGKTVIPFCTSSSSGLGESGTHLAELAGTGNWQEGQRFGSSAGEDEVTGWLSGLGF